MKLLSYFFKSKGNAGVDFLPDADAIEKAPVAAGIPITLYSLIAMLIVFFAWAAFAEIDQVVVASGRLTSTQPNIIIQPIETSQVESICLFCLEF
jgi:HlyD family secretion protein